MSHTISEHEMNRRQACADAKSRLTEAMGECPELTAVEWLYVLDEISRRMLGMALKEEWEGE